MKKFLIGTTALITAGMLVSSVANAQVTNAAKDTINFELSGSIKSTIAFGTNSLMSNSKKNTVDKSFKNSIRNFDIWNEGDLEGTASYKASDESAKVKSVKAHITLVDGAIVLDKKDLSMFVETDTAFGNIILGDQNFTSVMGVIGNYDDDTGSDYKTAYGKDYATGEIASQNISGVMEFTNDDLADDIEARIQYNTGDLIKLNEDGSSKIVIGASVALSPENTEYVNPLMGDDNDDFLVGDSDYVSNQGFNYYQGNMANLVIAGGASYIATFAGNEILAVATFQHTNGVNAFNVSGSDTLLGGNLTVRGGMSMLMYGDYTKQDGTKLKKSESKFKDQGPVMSFYADGNYTVNDFTFGAGAHLGFQSRGDSHDDKGKKITAHDMEIGVSAEANLQLAENVNWTMAKVNFDMSSKNYTSNSAGKFGGAETAFGLQSVVKVSF